MTMVRAIHLLMESAGTGHVESHAHGKTMELHRHAAVPFTNAEVVMHCDCMVHM